MPCASLGRAQPDNGVAKGHLVIARDGPFRAFDPYDASPINTASSAVSPVASTIPAA
jgi:hypothetical protein